MSDLHVEQDEGTTITTVVPVTAPPTDLSNTPPPQEDTPVAAAEAEGEEPEAPADSTPEGEKKTKYQSRIDRLIQERYEAEAKAAVEAERRARLEEELAQLRQAPPARPAPTAVEGEPQRGDYPDDDQYIAALVAYRTRQEVAPVLAAVQQTIEAERAERARVDAQRIYLERIAAVRSEYPDFDEMTSKDLPVSPVMAEVILTSPAGPRVSYYLGSHPEECVALSKLPPVQAAVELGRLEARLSAATTGTATQATRSAAPPPVKPVGGAPTTTAASIWDSHISQHEFERIRNEQEKARRSR